MFEENENLVTEEVTENVEELATEETVEIPEEPVEEKKYTEAELNAEVDRLLAKKIAIKQDKIRRDYEKKYGKLEAVLKAGTGESDLDTITNTFETFYTRKGVEIPNYETSYSDEENEVLADNEAKKIIDLGYNEVKEEVDRLAEIGVSNMTPREKVYFSKLAEFRKEEESRRELAKIGVGADALKDNDFLEFEKKLNPSMSVKEKYEMYLEMKPKKQIDKMGSMKSGPVSKVKDSYTAEEIERLTEEDLDNPQVWEAVRRSMTGRA